MARSVGKTMASGEPNMTDETKRPEAEGVKDSAFGRVTRRSFLSQLGAAGVTVASVRSVTPASAQTVPPAQASQAEEIEGAVALRLRVNGKDVQIKVDPRTTLLDGLRETIHLTGTK